VEAGGAGAELGVGPHVAGPEPQNFMYKLRAQNTKHKTQNTKHKNLESYNPNPRL